MESLYRHEAKFLAITNNANNYAGVRQFAYWSKTASMCLCSQAVRLRFLDACTLVVWSQALCTI